MRENGYYWVRFRHEDKWNAHKWQIAEWNGSSWYFIGCEIDYSEEEVTDTYEIGEKVDRKEKV